MKSYTLIISILITLTLSFKSSLNIDYKELLKDSSVHFPQKDGILILTSETIDEALKTYPKLAILMFAPWCPHCKAFYPEMAKALEIPLMKKMGVVFGRVDIEYNEKVQTDYEVYGLPTVIYFENGAKKEIYGGGRTADTIVEWFYKRLINPTHNLETLDEIKEYEKPKDHKLIYFGNNPEKIKEYERFVKTRDDITFGLVKSEKLIKEYGKTPETLTLFKNFDDPPYVDIKNITFENIQNEIKLNQFPLIIDECQDLLSLMVGYHFTGAFLLINENDKEKTPSIEKSFTSIAKKYRSKIMFCKADIKSKIGAKIIRISNTTKTTSEKTEPGIIIMDFVKGFNKWKGEDFYKEFSISNMEKFVDDYMDGKMKPPIKSEEIPEKQENAVYKLVNKSFKKEVLDSNVNVFVKFYSPKCPHCIKLEPAYNELAEKLRDNKKVLIAEYNLLANDFDWFSIRGYPTLIMFKAGDKDNHIVYSGNRTVEDMMNSVMNNLGEIKEKKEEVKKEEIKKEVKKEVKKEKPKKEEVKEEPKKEEPKKEEPKKEEPKKEEVKEEPKNEEPEKKNEEVKKKKKKKKEKKE